jgi:hypothetical protein
MHAGIANGACPNKEVGIPFGIAKLSEVAVAKRQRSMARWKDSPVEDET